MSNHRFILAACFACMLPFQVFSEAPVVDDSENFALLDDQQAAYERPFAKESGYATDSDEESALANDHEEGHRNNNNYATLLNKLRGLQQDVQELRGQLEVQAHDVKLLQQQQLAFYKDLDARISHEPTKMANTGSLTEPSTSPKKAPQPWSASGNKTRPQPIINPVNTSRINPADEQISYLAAYELVKNKKFDEATIAMQSFVTKYPQGGYTANAQYWLGELCMVKRDYTGAIQHFEVVLQQFPSSTKTAASLLKIGYALAESGNKQEAIRRLQHVMTTYPDTNTAQLAKAKLDALNR
jgi:tol-pal system protein YbgF